MTIDNILKVSVLIAFGVMIGILATERTHETEAIYGRLDIIEERLDNKLSPRISVTYGTIYNSKGEIIVEDISKKIEDYKKKARDDMRKKGMYR